MYDAMLMPLGCQPRTAKGEAVREVRTHGLTCGLSDIVIDTVLAQREMEKGRSPLV
jgi:hypothetical protein